jgi:molybdate transport system regulatory protein
MLQPPVVLGSVAPPRLNAPMPEPAHAPVRVSIRIDLPGGRVGPGKIAVLEAIMREGSISAAARALGMSYPRAWALVDSVDSALGVPAVSRAPGGQRGGGAALTPSGEALVVRYRKVEAAAQREAGPVPDTPVPPRPRRAAR